jgi:ribosomal-protein-alanine N-acetyltransferase
LRNRWSDKILVRELGREDLEAVASLESSGISGWSKSLVAEELGRPNALALVAVVSEKVVGWCCASLVGAEAELLKICVEHGMRRKRCGTELLTVLQQRLHAQGAEHLFLEVRSRNRAAVLFYSRLGFTAVGRRINYYSRPSDDALILKASMSLQQQR